MSYKTLKEIDGFQPGDIVYLKTDFGKRMPLVVKEILEMQENKEFGDLTEFNLKGFQINYKPDIEDDAANRISVVCQHQTSQRTIATVFLSPTVITKKPG